MPIDFAQNQRRLRRQARQFAEDVISPETTVGLRDDLVDFTPIIEVVDLLRAEINLER